MTKQQIKDLVSAKIAGQGTMVDAGGGLPTILNEIIDALPEGGNEPLVIEAGNITEDTLNEVSVSAETFAEMKASFGNRPIIIKADLYGDIDLLVSGYSVGSVPDAVPEGFCASGFVGDSVAAGEKHCAYIVVVKS